MAETIIVTGGTGFIGRHAVEDLVARGFKVIVPTSRDITDGVDGATYLTCDLTDAADRDKLIGEANASGLLHIAWRAAVSGLWGAPENIDWLQSSLALGRAFLDAGGQRITLCGSCGEYDWTSGMCIEDQTPLRPNTIYGTAKVSVMHGLSAMCQTAGATLATGRPFFIYGPREHESRLTAYVIQCLMRGEEAACSHGMQLRDYSHVADVGRGMAALAASNLAGEYNIATGEAVRVKDVILEIAKAIGRPELVKLGAREAPAHEPPLIVADMAKTRASGLDWAPRFTLESGVADTIDWFRANA
ncbi:NAD(P)-dependent oxidoreductase [Hyphomonas sp.]|uniref:NAD-dependent epimerase/dehydratase family protein n=1 Tax=Hyphomonas sp. TaxID=87 RepID=UPI0025B7E494|nr:NAD(P)-dependent oxidoreductase [Hyphomonas sp.]